MRAAGRAGSPTADTDIRGAKEQTRHQADETRLATATPSIGSQLPAERVAGFTFLRRLATQRLETANRDDVSEVDRRDVLALYHGTLDVLATYLHEPIQGPEGAR